MNTQTLYKNLRQYYGKELQSSADLKTSACCDSSTVPEHLKPYLSNLEDEVQTRFYGCGSPLPEGLSGCTMLDLGCGSGRDAFVASQLVGPHGFVYGVDMTAEQLEVARRNVDPHMKRFGYEKPNVSFLESEMEALQQVGIADESIDVAISNCVLNLAANKEQVFHSIWQALKPGGELYFSDVFASRRLPKQLMEDPVLHGECLAGALYTEDFRRLLLNLDVPDYRVVTSRPIEVKDTGIRQKLGEVQFYSMTVRCFKLNNMEDRCEDYGQIATYLGGLQECPNAFQLDDHHLFEKDRPQLVCGNTASMLQETRLNKYFEIQGNREKHFGLFGCATNEASSSSDDRPPSGFNKCC